MSENATLTDAEDGNLRITFCLPPDLAEFVKRQAAENENSTSGIIRLAVKKYREAVESPQPVATDAAA